MANQPGQLYMPSGASEIRDDFLTDVRLEAIAQGETNPPVHPGTDWWVLGTGLANIGIIQYANLSISEKNASVLDATGAQLDRIREALGLPVVDPTPSRGALTIQKYAPAINVPDGTQGILPNGLRIKTDGAQLLPVTPAGLTSVDLNVVAIDTGSKTNLAAGALVRLVSPPPGMLTDTLVSVNAPLAGGLDAETDERKRWRILNRLQNVPAGGNWGHAIEVALNALATLQYAFVYPALGGPSSVKVALCKPFDPAIRDFSRAFSLSATQYIRQALQAEFPSPIEIVVQSVANERFDASILVTIPDSTLSGGGGDGWADSVPWPPLVVGDAGRTPISVVTDSSHITVDADTAVSPVAGQTHVMWWSSVDQKFSTRLITAVAGGAGAWQLTLDAPITDGLGVNPIVGEYISPACVNADAYRDTWITSIGTLGAGENTADANRLPRAYRHPLAQDSWPMGLTIAQLADMRNAHHEISDAAWSWRSLSAPTTPAAVLTAPNILAPRHFGIYEQ